MLNPFPDHDFAGPWGGFPQPPAAPPGGVPPAGNDGGVNLLERLLRLVPGIPEGAPAMPVAHRNVAAPGPPGPPVPIPPPPYWVAQWELDVPPGYDQPEQVPRQVPVQLAQAAQAVQPPAPAQVPKAQNSQPKKDAAKAALPADAAHRVEQRARPPRPAGPPDENLRQPLNAAQGKMKPLIDPVTGRLDRQRVEEWEAMNRAEQARFRANVKNLRAQQVVEPWVPRRKERPGQAAAGALAQAHLPQAEPNDHFQAYAHASQAQTRAAVAKMKAAKAVAAKNMLPARPAGIAAPQMPGQARNMALVARQMRMEQQQPLRHDQGPGKVLAAYGNRIAQHANRAANEGMLGGPARL